jgi:hypothetical protein
VPVRNPEACEFVRSKSLLHRVDSSFPACGFAADNFGDDLLQRDRY